MANGHTPHEPPRLEPSCDHAASPIFRPHTALPLGQARAAHRPCPRWCEDLVGREPFQREPQGGAGIVDVGSDSHGNWNQGPTRIVGLPRTMMVTDS